MLSVGDLQLLCARKRAITYEPTETANPPAIIMG